MPLSSAVLGWSEFELVLALQHSSRRMPLSWGRGCGLRIVFDPLPVAVGGRKGRLSIRSGGTGGKRERAAMRALGASACGSSHASAGVGGMFR